MLMDLLVVKLEGFGLENFIKVHQFTLCTRTVSPNKIAVALQFDADQCAIISAFPDDFSKCEKLYEFVQKTCKVKDFLAALGNTGNEHILRFIEKGNFSITEQQSLNRSRGIWFNIPEPIESFCGRACFISRLHQKLQSKYGNLNDPRSKSILEVTVLSQVKIISGLGGIGKTQTVRRYMMTYWQFYNNFIWIGAETENSLRNSFLKLAKEIQIPVQISQGNSIEIQDIVKEIYNKICDGEKSNLIIFDNAEDYQSCAKFFPFGIHPDLRKPVILATSRNQEWISPIGNIPVLCLDVLTESESFEFILKQLEIPDSDSDIKEFREESQEFIILIGGLPLALQQAVAYIKQEKKAQGLLGHPYKMSDYVEEFRSSTKKLQNFPYAPGSPTTVFVTWNVTFEKMKKDPKGHISIEIIQVMSFLYADRIPVEFLRQLLPLHNRPQKCNWIWKSFSNPKSGQDLESKCKKDLVEGLNFLEKFSMIKIDGKGKCVSIHRQVQFVIMENLRSSGRLHDLFGQLLENCGRALRNTQFSESESEVRDIFGSVQQIMNNELGFTPISKASLWPHFMREFGLIMYKSSRGRDRDPDASVESENRRVEWSSLDWFKKVKIKQQQLFHENPRRGFYSLKLMAPLYFLIFGRYIQPSASSQILTKINLLLIFERFTTFVHRFVGLFLLLKLLEMPYMTFISRRQFKYAETQVLLEQLLAETKEMHGENHELTHHTRRLIDVLYRRIRMAPGAKTKQQRNQIQELRVLGQGSNVGKILRKGVTLLFIIPVLVLVKSSGLWQVFIKSSNI